MKADLAAGAARAPDGLRPIADLDAIAEVAAGSELRRFVRDDDKRSYVTGGELRDVGGEGKGDLLFTDSGLTLPRGGG